MKNIFCKLITGVTLFVFFVGIFGCATYTFDKGQDKPYKDGFVVSRDGYEVVEYTLGENNSVPENVELAEERFKRRRETVEKYYKEMGHMENRFNENILQRCMMFLGGFFGIFKMPFMIISNYKYENDPEYRKKMDEIELEKIKEDQERKEKLKLKLHSYIEQDLSRNERVEK